MTDSNKSQFTRREAITILGTATAGVIAGASGAVAVERVVSSTESGAVGQATVPFFGIHQAGIETPIQAHGTFIAFDLNSGASKDSVARLLRVWSSDMQLLASGQPAMGDAAPELAATPASLTFTLGFGHSLFSKLGMQSSWPIETTRIPSFSIDKLEAQWSDGDLIVQVCGNDSLTMSHAVREIIRGAKPFATPRWSQTGFNPHAGVGAGKTPRNLMGQVDGTGNPKIGSAAFADAVWSKSSHSWFDGGSTLVLRRIRMLLDTWETLPPDAQESVIGRKRSNGAPLTGTHENDLPDMTAMKSGTYVIAEDAHIRRATTPQNIYRRIFNYDDGVLPDGSQDVGLLFAAYQSDPKHFIQIQQNLADMDSLNRWTVPIGSGLWLMPKGLTEGDWLASDLFA